MPTAPRRAAPPSIPPPSVPLRDHPLARLRARPLRATFLGRPNRFVAEVRLATGELVAAHLPNSGRLTGTLAPGRVVLLDGPCDGRRCPYTVVAAREGRTWVGTVTTYANRVFPALWRGGLFPELAGSDLAAEVAHGRSRFDFTVDGAFVEVKSVTLVAGRVARFPDAVTARGARHCDELGRLALRGVPVAIVFVAQRGDVDAVEPEDEVDPAFGAALRRAARRGARVLACALAVTPGGAVGARRVPVRL
ncbi:DNA/RNA nuclease SfsA [Anaeromyxobacter oryzae]|uniref:Sugar fermentation stimulation protein homolog n=1 Tax=Anaeromyxobacter oryzae TaxID=2918170 RepID=A0ABM7WRN6_9BACT|nr:DNA/RNA nuclease SfsA [Anaeromyxobacter oryzae]BDG02140.1 sugar fermentation stimulation protein [Anaeromyxobacter oryzae]